MKRVRLVWRVLALVVTLVVCGLRAAAQCAMCRTALAASPEGQRMAEGFTQGVLLLLAVPFGVVGAVAFLICRRQTGRAAPATPQADVPQRGRVVAVTGRLP